MIKFFKKKTVDIEKSEKFLTLEKDLKEKKPWLFAPPPEIIINKDNPPVIIYQMGKVGSTSVNFSLKQSGIPNPVYHVHQLRYDGIANRIKKNNKLINKNLKRKNIYDSQGMYIHFYLNYVNRQFENFRLLRKQIDKNINKIPWKIITLVRDPVMRQISDFFFSFQERPDLMNEKGEFLKEKSLEALKNEISRHLDPNRSYILKWFDKEFKEVLGIDVYEFPFDKKKGYTIIYAKNINILVFKLEKLDLCFSTAIDKFLNEKDVKLKKRNQAKQKFYFDAYKYTVDNITLNESLCAAIYSSGFVKHFYSRAEIESFKTKWTKR